jgi:hypothetical protein
LIASTRRNCPRSGTADIAGAPKHHHHPRSSGNDHTASLFTIRNRIKAYLLRRIKRKEGCGKGKEG